jgi:diguanylate cyclase (GGDEF)-like protein
MAEELGLKQSPPRLPPPAPAAGRGSLGALWGRVWEAPDPQLADAGAAGELLVAKIRAVLLLLILYYPLAHLVVWPHDRAAQIGLGLIGVALAQTLAVYGALRRRPHRYVFRLSCTSSLLDVSLVSVALASPLAFGLGGLAERTAGGERAVFAIYLLAIFATSLRYDARICVVTGAAAFVEYGAIALVAGVLARRGSAAAAGWVDWIDDCGRMLLLAAATLLSTALVVRGRELRRMTTRDPLTGVLNRGFFEERLSDEAARLEHARHPVACAMIDIDHFKRFNDAFGHEAGDEALRRIGGILGAAFRATDIVARYGGEEFAVVIPGLAPELARARMERIRKEVSAPAAAGGDGAHPARRSLTLSIGLAFFPAEAPTLRDALRAADRRLYEAKDAGRDRIAGP